MRKIKETLKTKFSNEATKELLELLKYNLRPEELKDIDHYMLLISFDELNIKELEDEDYEHIVAYLKNDNVLLSR